MAGKITQAELAELKQARDALGKLSTALGADSGASAYANAITTTEAAFGGSSSLDGHGDDIAKFVNARITKIKEVLAKTPGGVTTAYNLLDKTISNYEDHEKATTTAADSTPAGQSRTTSSWAPGS